MSNLSYELVTLLKVELPEEIVKEVEKILLSNKYLWLNLNDIEDFVADAVRRRVSELLWGKGFERSRS